MKRTATCSLPRALTLATVLLVSLTIVHPVEGQVGGITSMLNLRYPSQAVLQNGVAQVPVSFTLYFDYYSNPQGYLVWGIYTSGTSNLVEGSVASTPDPCQSLAATIYANGAICAMVPPTSAGSESASATLTLTEAQQYSLSVFAFVWDSRNLQSGNQVAGSTYTAHFTITVTGQAFSTSSATTATATSAGGTLVQQASNGCNTCSAISSITVSFPNSVTAGDIVVVAEMNAENCDCIELAQPTDSLGSSYTVINSLGTASATVELYFAKLSSSGADTITVGVAYFEGSSSYPSNVYIYEVSGVSAVHSSVTGSGSSSSASTSSTSFTAGAFLIAAVDTGTAITSFTPGTGFTSSAQTPATGFGGVEYSTSSGVSSPTTFPASFSPAITAWTEVSAEFEPLTVSGQTTSTSSPPSSQAGIATITVGSGPFGVAYDSGKSEVFVVDNGGNSVSVISDATNNVLATVNVGNDPIAVAYDSGKGEAFITNNHDNSVSVISDASNTVVATITGPGLISPVGVAYDPGKSEVFVTNNAAAGANSVSVISDATNTIIATITGLYGPSGAAFDSGKGEVFVENSDGTVSVISDASNTVVAKVTENVTGPNVGIGASYGLGVAYDSGKGEVFVTQGSSDAVAVISDATNAVVATVTGLSKPSDLAYDPADNEVFVTNNSGGSASAISDATNTVVATINVGSGPRGLTYDSAMGEVFVANTGSGTVSVVAVPSETNLATTTSAAEMTPYTSTSAQASSSPIGTLSQTDLLLVGVVVALAVFLAVIMLRRPWPGGRATGGAVRTDVIYCERCGARNAATLQFCEKCGAKLVKI